MWCHIPFVSNDERLFCFFLFCPPGGRDRAEWLTQYIGPLAGTRHFDDLSVFLSDLKFNNNNTSVAQICVRTSLSLDSV